MHLLKCVSFLLVAVILSATLGPFVAIAHREVLMELTDGNVLAGQMVALGDAVVKKSEANDGRSIPSSGANYSVGKCGHGGKEDQGVNCYFRSRKLHSGVYFDGHIPYTADYRKPHQHQPKNN